jgi:Stress responsive A/B Barrel Domain
MKSNFILFALLTLGCLTACQEKQPEKQQVTTPEKMLRHAVLFKFKDDAPAEDVKKVENAFRALPSQIKEIKSFEWGKNNSPEGLDQGFTHCFFVTFSSEKDRETYLPHPAHQAFVEVLKPHLDKVLVLDYWAEQ